MRTVLIDFTCACAARFVIETNVQPGSMHAETRCPNCNALLRRSLVVSFQSAEESRTGSAGVSPASVRAA